MSGQWPPEWEDADDGHSDAELPDGSAVTSFLAEVGSPALPGAFEARISAAIAAEAAARASVPQVAQAAATKAAGAPAADAGAEDAKDWVRSGNPEEFSPTAAAGGPATSANRRLRRASRTSGSTGGGSGPRGSRPDGRRRRLRMPSAQASGWVALCCLVIAGFGFLVTHTSSSSSSSAPYSAAAAPEPAASSEAGASEPHAANGGSQRENAGQEPTASAAASATVPTGFLYLKSGTAYQASTLATQVRVVLTEPVSAHLGSDTPANSSSASAPAATAPAESSASSSLVGGYVPSARLAACVSRVTGGVTPSLVDKATYDGKPAYIIAVPSQVWVVGLGCTAARTDVIARVPLKG
jgi:hypothetical protein